MIGTPRVHLRETASTNDVARALAERGAPHGTLVTAGTQTAGRGRQGRRWEAVRGRALAFSFVVRAPGELLPLAIAVAVAEVAGDAAEVKWPNDVLLGGRKIAGVLVESRPQAGWAVAGVGVNVAVRPEDLPAELRGLAGSLGREPHELEAVLMDLTASLARWLAEPDGAVIAALRARDALRGRPLSWDGGTGTGAGIADDGSLLVIRADGSAAALRAGEVHLGAPGA